MKHEDTQFLPLDEEEKQLMASIEAGEWKTVDNVEERKKEIMAAATHTLKQMKKNARVNIRMSSSDLDSLKIRAEEEGLPYQTLMSSVLHKYVTGRLREVIKN